MKSVLMISSFVAGSNVGGSLAMKVLSRLGVNVSLLPTTLLGRHPGWGVPGGGAVPDDLFAGMIEGLRANGVPRASQCIATGYFASAQQVHLAADLIAQQAGPDTRIIVDAVMGDFGKGLYVKDEVAQAVVERLLPLADIVKANAWEFWEIRRRCGEIRQMPEAPRSLVVLQKALQAGASERIDIVSSVRHGDEIGLLGVDAKGGFWAGHDEMPGLHMPNGVGDLVTTYLVREAMAGEPAARTLVASAVGDLLPVLEFQETDKPGELNLSYLGLVADTKRFSKVTQLW